MDWATAGSVLGVVSIIVAAVYVGRARGKDGLIELQERQNKALRDEMADQDRRCNAKIGELQSQVSHLQGKVDVLSEQQGAAIGAAIAPIVAETVVAALREVT